MTGKIAIGELARATGVKIATIRYYEGIGLLPAPPRTSGNRRSYDENAVGRLAFIRHARELGFDIQMIRELLALADQPKMSCAKVDALAREQVGHIRQRIEQLRALQAELERMIAACSKGRIAQCRIIETLSGTP